MDTPTPRSEAPAGRLRQQLRNLAAGCYAAGSVIVLVVANLINSSLPVNQPALNLLAAAGFLGALCLPWLPWSRFHRDLLLLHTAGGLTWLVLLVANSGGRQSPFLIYFFVVTAISALYHGRLAAFAAAGLATAASLAPFVAGAVDATTLLQSLMTIPVHCALVIAGQLARQGWGARETAPGRARDEEPAPDQPAQVGDVPERLATTPLMNAAELRERLAQMLEEYHGAGSRFGLVYLEIERFEEIASQQGGDADDIIRQAAVLLRNHSRSSDVAAHLGHGAFVLLLPRATSEIARLLGERLRSTIEQHRFWAQRSYSRLALRVKVAAAGCPEDGTTADELLAAAVVESVETRAED